MTDFNIIIPARLASTRLPEKLLKKIGGKTVLEHSYLAAKKSLAKRVIIAVDDEKLLKIANDFGAQAVWTDKAHPSGTDRLAECVEKLNFADDDIIVNVQGDEPFIPVKHIHLCAKALATDPRVPVATLATKINDASDINNPHVVKVVINQKGHALYFSRAGIPFNRDGATANTEQHYFHHLGIYAYRVAFLKQYTQLPDSHLEATEKLEQLRILDFGEKIAVAITDEKTPKGIDTEEDLSAAIRHFES